MSNERSPRLVFSTTMGINGDMRAPSARMQLYGCMLVQLNDCAWRCCMASVTREIVLPAERGETWRWLTDPGELSRWLAPEVELEPWEGGAIETAGEPDPRTGVVERVDPNEL